MGAIVLGIPGKVVKQVDDAIRARIAWGAESYLGLSARHQQGEFAKKGSR